ncbi:MAG: sugar phosphate isomerase/epimerase, partial [Clostridia bacterium]|nr:sugar phosphate isomerase/epimerase [Clostridia bacterium]
AGLSPEEFKKICDDTGLRIISAHGGYEFVIRDIEKTVETYEKLGAEYIVMAYSIPENLPGGENYEKHSEELRRSCEYAKKHGMQILFHNHERELKRWGDSTVLDGIIEGTGGALMYEPDLCWVKIGGIDPVDFLKARKGKCPVVHIKDFYCDSDYEANAEDPCRPESFQFRPIGYGRQDIPAILDKAEETGAKWLIVEQDCEALGKNQLECAELSIRWLRTER